ncbi:MAG: asparagine synthase (glutamine-hydrolyzing) [Alphaproteobacteria bacterium]
MCGIAGIMSRDGSAPDIRLLDRFAAALLHRGPDGEGRHAQGDVAMVQRRLAIIDLVTGDQPLYEPGGAALVANGEIYNYIELRQAMPETAFRTGSDCEAPLHLYRRDGLEFARSLRGMYAIAIHDPAEGRLVLARDPFGIKPLYYVETATLFAFASEPQALVAAGLVRPELAPEPRDELLQLQFTCGRHTIFRGIERVLPGETLVVQGGRVVERRRLPALPEAADPPPATTETALARLDAVLEESVALHQRSDVPYGLFLSGGIDSASVLALMARLNERPVRCFTVGFGGTAVHDERTHARTLAAAVGAQHVEVPFDEADFLSLLPRVAAAMDEPAADYAVLPTWKLAREASKDLKVVLSGEGGDELFGGYGRYRSVMRPWWLGGRTLRARGTFDRLGVLRDERPGWRDGIAAAETMAALPGRTRLQTAQAVDIADWLPNDLLTKLDRCLMAHGLEGRTPFLDPAVARFAFPLPDARKVHKGRGKWLLRCWLDKVLPQAQPFARKRGFTVPVGEWLHRNAARLGPLVARDPAVAALCRPDRVAPLFAATDKRAGFAAWTLLFYALWHRRHMRGLDPGEGDVFDVLGSDG